MENSLYEQRDKSGLGFFFLNKPSFAGGVGDLLEKPTLFGNRSYLSNMKLKRVAGTLGLGGVAFEWEYRRT